MSERVIVRESGWSGRRVVSGGMEGGVDGEGDGERRMDGKEGG